MKERFQLPVQKTVSEDAMQQIMNYEWPGNIRELENVMERAALLSTGKMIQAKDLLLSSNFGTQSLPNGESTNPIGTSIPLSELDRLHIEAVLKNSSWNKNEAAKILDISLKTLYTKIATYQIKPN